MDAVLREDVLGVLTSHDRRFRRIGHHCHTASRRLASCMAVRDDVLQPDLASVASGLDPWRDDSSLGAAPLDSSVIRAERLSIGSDRRGLKPRRHDVNMLHRSTGSGPSQTERIGWSRDRRSAR